MKRCVNFFETALFGAVLLSSVLSRAGVESSAAENLCGTSIQVNDSSAMVSVDGLLLGAAPLMVKCKSKAQTISVMSTDKQVFTRVIPGKNEFTEGNRFWNVYFVPQGIDHARGDAGTTHLQLQSSNESKVLQELAEIRQVLERLVAMHPELKPRLPKPNLINLVVDRSVSSVSSLAAPSQILNGVFVQLHALSRKAFKTDVIEEELKSHKDKMSGSYLSFCKLHQHTPEREWTRVLVGPFVNATAARTVKKIIGRDTFLVKNPSCYSKPKGKVGI